MILDAEFWVAAAFVVFIGILIYLGVHRKIAEALKSRQERIRLELDEARRLRDEAQQLLAEYQIREQQAKCQAANIISDAEAQAQQISADAKSRLEELTARRTKVTELRIAQAEAMASSQIRAAAVDLAVAAAERILVRDANANSAKYFMNSLGEVTNRFQRSIRV